MATNYSSAAPTVRCRDCGMILDWNRGEHVCYAQMGSPQLQPYSNEAGEEGAQRKPRERPTSMKPQRRSEIPDSERRRDRDRRREREREKGGDGRERREKPRTERPDRERSDKDRSRSERQDRERSDRDKSERSDRDREKDREKRRTRAKSRDRKSEREERPQDRDRRDRHRSRSERQRNNSERPSQPNTQNPKITDEIDAMMENFMSNLNIENKAPEHQQHHPRYDQNEPHSPQPHSLNQSLLQQGIRDSPQLSNAQLPIDNGPKGGYQQQQRGMYQQPYEQSGSPYLGPASPGFPNRANTGPTIPASPGPQKGGGDVYNLNRAETYPNAQHPRHQPNAMPDNHGYRENMQPQRQNSYDMPPTNDYNNHNPYQNGQPYDQSHDKRLDYDQGVPSARVVEICGGCNKEIREEEENDVFEIEALNKLYHISCFRCCVCSIVFSDEVPYIPHMGQAYCEPHHDELVFRPVCFGCGNPVYNKPIYALGKPWHPEHLICASCRTPIQGNVFEHDGEVYCAADYTRLVAPVCFTCRNPIQGETICAIGNTYHRHCFTCSHPSCRRGFENKSFYVFDGKPYCQLHYHQCNNSLCGECREPIEGPCAEVAELNKRFHPGCWVCYACKTPLTGTYYSFNQHAYCENDIMKVYNEQQRSGGGGGANPNKRRTFMNNI